MTAEQHKSLADKIDQLLEGESWILAFGSRVEDRIEFNFAGSVNGKEGLKSFLDWLSKNREELLRRTPEI